jgi:hypothetical protein
MAWPVAHGRYQSTKERIMINKFASLALVIALVSTLGGNSALANSPTKPRAIENVTVVLREIEIS